MDKIIQIKEDPLSLLIGGSNDFKDRDCDFIEEAYKEICEREGRIPYFEEISTIVNNHNLACYIESVDCSLSYDYSEEERQIAIKSIAVGMYNEDSAYLSINVIGLIFYVLESKKLPYYDDYNKPTFMNMYGLNWADFDILVNPTQTVLSEDLYETLTGYNYGNNYFLIIDRRDLNELYNVK